MYLQNEPDVRENMHKLSSTVRTTNNSSLVQNRRAIATVGQNNHSTVGVIRLFQDYVPRLLLARWGMKSLGLILDTKIYGQ